jgi:hypothetical protein
VGVYGHGIVHASIIASLSWRGYLSKVLFAEAANHEELLARSRPGGKITVTEAPAPLAIPTVAGVLASGHFASASTEMRENQWPPILEVRQISSTSSLVMTQEHQRRERLEATLDTTCV